jgi:hypothetical protein
MNLSDHFRLTRSSARSTLLAFFDKVEKPVNRRQRLDTPVPARLTHPPPVGRIAFLPIHLSSDAAGSERLRRYRARGTSSVPRFPRLRTVPAREGFRVERECPLAVEHLWISDAPPYKAVVDDIYRCNVCLQLMSHPVLWVLFLLGVSALRIY